MRRQDFGLRRLARLPGLNLDDLDRPKAQRATGRRGALGIVAGERRFWRPPELSDREERDPQLAVTRAGGSTDQIFSML